MILEINNLTDKDYRNSQIESIIDYYLPMSRYPIYIELWDHDAFLEYFDIKSKIKDGILDQPLGPNKEVEGHYDFTELKNQLTHCIAIIYNENWQTTLKHECIHGFCAERMGKNLWNDIGQKWKDKRKTDPFEYIAIALANPDLIYFNNTECCKCKHELTCGKSNQGPNCFLYKKKEGI